MSHHSSSSSSASTLLLSSAVALGSAAVWLYKKSQIEKRFLTSSKSNRKDEMQEPSFSSSQMLKESKQQQEQQPKEATMKTRSLDITSSKASSKQEKNEKQSKSIESNGEKEKPAVRGSQDTLITMLQDYPSVLQSYVFNTWKHILPDRKTFQSSLFTTVLSLTTNQHQHVFPSKSSNTTSKSQSEPSKITKEPIADPLEAASKISNNMAMKETELPTETQKPKESSSIERTKSIDKEVEKLISLQKETVSIQETETHIEPRNGDVSATEPVKTESNSTNPKNLSVKVAEEDEEAEDLTSKTEESSTMSTPMSSSSSSSTSSTAAPMENQTFVFDKVPSTISEVVDDSSDTQSVNTADMSVTSRRRIFAQRVSAKYKIADPNEMGRKRNHVNVTSASGSNQQRSIFGKGNYVRPNPKDFQVQYQL